MKLDVRKCICVIICLMFISFTGCKPEPTSPTVHTELQVPTVTPPVTSIATMPSASVEATLPENKMFKVYEFDGIQIRLPPTFELQNSSQPIVLDNWYCGIIMHNEPFSAHPDLPGMTLEQYAQACMDFSGIDADLEWMDGILCHEYELPVGDGRYNYHWVTFFKSNSEFWIIEFVCDSRDADKRIIQFIQWAKSIEFSEPKAPVV